jgi:hypothetical protein
MQQEKERKGGILESRCALAAAGPAFLPSLFLLLRLRAAVGE